MPVSSWGTGRPDYSANIETSVQPVIRSWETEYLISETYDDLAGNGTENRYDVTVPNGYITVIYDAMFTADRNVLLGLVIAYYNSTAETWDTIFQDYGYQKVHHILSQGFPISGNFYYILYNYDSETVNTLFHLSGFRVTEDMYNQSRSEV